MPTTASTVAPRLFSPEKRRDDYYTADWQLIQEDSTLPATTIFYWGQRYIDELIARFDLRSSAFIYSLPDANWNVVAIADPTADDGAGAIVERYAYTPYGVVQFLAENFTPLTGNASAYGWETLFCGYRYDAAIGLYLVRNRLLLPPLGCWLSRDPKAAGRPFSLGEYSESRPLSLTDPGGEQCASPKGIQFVPGRGTFSTLSMTNDIKHVGSDVVITFRLNYINWPRNSSGCCCCTKIGFIQVILYQAEAAA